MTVASRTTEDLIKEIEQLRKQVRELMSLKSGSVTDEDHAVPLPIELILEKAQEAIVVIQDGRHKYVNKKAAENGGYSIDELLDKPIEETIHPDDYDKVIRANDARLKGNTVKYKYRVFGKKRQIIWQESYGIRILWKGEPASLCFINDITAQINAENELREKTVILEQTNTALNVLLQHRERDLNEVEARVVNNIKELVIPYIEKLKALRLNPEAVSYIDIIETHATEIVSPFLMKLSHQYWNMTPREIQIASLVKDGKTTKEISELLNVSIETVNRYRKRLRKKLNLKKKDENLRSHLLFFDNGKIADI